MLAPQALPGCQVSHEVILGRRVLQKRGSLLPAPSSVPAQPAFLGVSQFLSSRRKEGQDF